MMTPPLSLSVKGSSTCGVFRDGWTSSAISQAPLSSRSCVSPALPRSGERQPPPPRRYTRGGHHFKRGQGNNSQNLRDRNPAAPPPRPPPPPTNLFPGGRNPPPAKPSTAANANIQSGFNLSR